LAELEAILDASRKVEKEKQRFAAALQGVKLDDETTDEELTGDVIRRRAEAKVRGVTEEAVELGEVGFAIFEE
jgi:acyl-CoA reductase-like NAD-dependent aldehyde dehydrogenase